MRTGIFSKAVLAAVVLRALLAADGSGGTTVSAAVIADWAGGTGDFGDTTQWVPALVPGLNDEARFSQGGTVSFNGYYVSNDVVVSGPAQTTFSLGLPAESGPHAYMVVGSQAVGLGVENGNLAISGGSVGLLYSGALLTGSNVQVGSYGTLLVNGATEISKESVLTVGTRGTLSVADLTVAGSGRGTLNVVNPATGVSPQVQANEVSIGVQAGSQGNVNLQGGLMTVRGTMYVGGSAAGAGGVGSVQVTSYGGTFFGSGLSADQLVVYPGSSVMTNYSSQITTNMAYVAGSMELLSTKGSGGGLVATGAVTLADGSHTHLETQIRSPMVTLSSNAVLVADNMYSSISGNVMNNGEITASKLRIDPYWNGSSTGPGNFTQLATGVLIGTAGSEPFLNVANGTAMLGGTLRLMFAEGTVLQAGDWFPVLRASSIVGSFDKIELVGVEGLTGVFSNATGNVTLTDGTANGGVLSSGMPEPSSLALVGMAAAGLGWRLRRRGG